MPNWCTQRFVVTGSTAAAANAFVGDFERAFHAQASPPEPAQEIMTFIGPHPDGSFTHEVMEEEAYHASCMQGVFETHPESVMGNGPRVVANPQVQRATDGDKTAYVGFKGK